MGLKNKKKKNAFSCFLDEYIHNEREKGRNVSHKIAAEECGSLWKKVSDKDKIRYKEMAISHNKNNKSNMNDKYSSQGKSYKEIIEKQLLEQKKLESADEDIKMTVSQSDPNLLSHQLFYIIHCNYYCQTDMNVYIPGEIAISEFNLNDGIKRTYHQLINPGEIPLGFAYEAQQNINEIHKLPYPPYPQGNSNISNIYTDIINFIKPGATPRSKIPPLYCLERNINACESILNKLAEYKKKKTFRVYLLHKLFFALKNKCAENMKDAIGFPVLSNAILELEKDAFCYVPGISCDYHVDMEDKYYNCSLSIVVRHVYVICDHCCELLNISIVPGKHSRLKCDVNRSQTVMEIEETMRHLASKPEVSKFGETSLSCFHEDDDSAWTKITSKSFYDDLKPFEHGDLKKTFNCYSSLSPGRRHKNSNNIGKNENVEKTGLNNFDIPIFTKGRGRPF